MSQAKPISVAIGRDVGSWHERFAEALRTRASQGLALTYDIVDLERHDWVEILEPFEVVIWQPQYMGPRSSGYLKEKIFFLEEYLHKVVVPNFHTVWHFESKIAQSWLFALLEAPVPRTVASFSYVDASAQLDESQLPLVFKKSFGASSQNVSLVARKGTARRRVAQAFSQQLWDLAKARQPSPTRRLLASVGKPWFWAKVRQKLLQDERTGSVYWQEFVPGNDADLRITVIGDRFAYGFWRRNRPGDFRASGSGRIAYTRSIPEEPLRYCIGLNRKLGFDSMAYDILFTPDRFVITEMSYGYIDSAPFKAEGHFVLRENGSLEYEEGRVWPQWLWVEWALMRAQRELSE
jgi:glutathione synthase/RimK-type ligase-like ATP-grasp enzyme